MTCSREKVLEQLFTGSFYFTWCTLNFTAHCSCVKKYSGISDDRPRCGPSTIADPPAIVLPPLLPKQTKTHPFARHRGHTLRYFALQT